MDLSYSNMWLSKNTVLVKTGIGVPGILLTVLVCGQASHYPVARSIHYFYCHNFAYPGKILVLEGHL